MSKLLLLLLLLSYTLSLTFGALISQFNQAKELKKQVMRKQAVLDSRERYVDKLEKVALRIDEHEEELKKIEYAVPKTPDLSYTLEFLDHVVSEGGLILGEVGGFSTTTVEKNEEKKLEETSLSISAVGPYESLLYFLEEVENSVRLIEVNSVNLSRSEREETEEAGLSLFGFEVMLSTTSASFEKQSEE